MPDNIIAVKRTTITRLAIIGVARLMIAAFLGGYYFGGGRKTVMIMQGGSPPQQLPQELRQSGPFPPGGQPLRLPPQQQLSIPPATQVTIPRIALDKAPIRGDAHAKTSQYR